MCYKGYPTNFNPDFLETEVSYEKISFHPNSLYFYKKLPFFASTTNYAPPYIHIFTISKII